MLITIILTMMLMVMIVMVMVMVVMMMVMVMMVMVMVIVMVMVMTTMEKIIHANKVLSLLLLLFCNLRLFSNYHLSAAFAFINYLLPAAFMTQGKIDLRNESGRPMKVKVVGEVLEK